MIKHAEKYKFIYDAGHAWLKVPHSHIPPHIGRNISVYSYQSKLYAYLEEDRDAGIFIQYLRTHGVEFKYYEKSAGDDWYGRTQLESYNAGETNDNTYR